MKGRKSWRNIAGEGEWLLEKKKKKEGMDSGQSVGYVSGFGSGVTAVLTGAQFGVDLVDLSLEPSFVVPLEGACLHWCFVDDEGYLFHDNVVAYSWRWL
ncbi:hypothetical protein TIFTF001_026065 [Ficus carica]|uniref:Uncharacterized protein n=1 Tax=Ficus carica TaxID=3494 RepID=A0AA88ARP4_FICCA|nr:hypothetical protein TIFTF001_026065 [Ficus carica]